MDRNISMLFAIIVLVITNFTTSHIKGDDEPMKQIIAGYLHFPTSLETLQKQINYTFGRIDLLRRAMTHASFSEENNRALSILGTSIIESSISLRYLQSDIDISSKVPNRKLAEISNVESCAVDGMRLGLHKVVRVSHKTNSTSPAILCGAFRGIFGAIALDTGKSNDAETVFWYVHTDISAGGVFAEVLYGFGRIDLLRRAMPHASFSEENNRALSILGTSIIELSISLRYLQSDIDLSSKVLNRKIAEISNVESSCAVDGMRLGLHKVVRVSHKTNSTSPAILCGAFRGIFGAIALDAGKSNDAETVFCYVHTDISTGGVFAEV